MSSKAFNMQRVVQVVQRAALMSRRLFCFPLDTLLSDVITCCPAQNHQRTVDKTTQHEAALLSPPSTILIVNISNSTLIDCVIGNDTYGKAMVAESQPLMQAPEHNVHDQRCSCSHGQQGAEHAPPPSPPSCPVSPEEPPYISINSSYLNCVIIGDNNYMQSEQIHQCDALTENVPH